MRAFTSALILSRLAAATPIEGGCTVLAVNGGGPVPGDGSIKAYLADTNSLAESAKTAYTPPGYKFAFSNRQGASFQLDGYITYKIMKTADYDVDQCANFCTATANCEAFNIYYERDPKFEDEIGSRCVNPPPVTNIKCALFSEQLNEEKTTNTHQFDSHDHKNAFQNVQVGSNGYNKVATTPVQHVKVNDALFQYSLVESLGTAAIEAHGSHNSYMTYKLFEEDTYKPELCAKECLKSSQFRRKCTFFNSYTLRKNGKTGATYCAMFSRAYGTEYATNKGYFDNGDHYTIENSHTYGLIGQ